MTLGCALRAALGIGDALRRLDPFNEKERKCSLHVYRFNPKQGKELVAFFACLMLRDKAADADPEKLFKAVINALLEVNLINADQKKIDMIPTENMERIHDAMFRIGYARGEGRAEEGARRDLKEAANRASDLCPKV